jgi:hypothetical protein
LGNNKREAVLGVDGETKGGNMIYVILIIVSAFTHFACYFLGQRRILKDLEEREGFMPTPHCGVTR